MSRKQYFVRMLMFGLVAIVSMSIAYWAGSEGIRMPSPNPTALLGVLLWVALGLAIMAFLAPAKWIEAKPGRAKLIERSRKVLVGIAVVIVGAWLLLDFGFDPRGLLRSVFDPSLIGWAASILANAALIIALWSIAAGVPYPLRKWWTARKAKKAQRRADKAAKSGAAPRVAPDDGAPTVLV